MVVVAILGSPCLGIMAAHGACPTAQSEVRIETAHGEIRELSDVTVAEVARAAKARNSPLRHPIVGAYSRSIGITLNIDDAIVEVSGNRRCAMPKVVHVRIFLTDRAVHLLENSSTFPACSSWREDTSKSMLKPTMPCSIA